jgi:hypothetical protein
MANDWFVCLIKQWAMIPRSIYFKQTAVVVFWLLSLSGLQAQHGENQEEHRRSGDEYNLYYSDSLMIGDSVVFRVDQQSYKNTREFYDSLRNKAQRSRLTRILYDFMVVGEDQEVLSRGDQVDEKANPYRVYGGRPIRNIYIRQLDVFDGLLKDSAQEGDNWYKEVGSWIHIPTHESIIRENLLFRPGDTLDPSLLRDNGRVLRNLQHIKDARFIVQPAEGASDSVDVVVLTQDLWSKGFDVNMESINSGGIELFDNNFMGLGHRFQTNFMFDYFKKSNPGIETSYKVNNIRGSFIDGRLYYMNAFESNRYGFELNRDFYSYKTRMVGGASVFRTKTQRTIVQQDTIFRQTPLNYINHDLWLGYAFQLPSANGFFQERNRLVLSSRYRNDRYYDHPAVTERYNYRFHDNQLFLGKISFSRENFYKSALVYGFGRTEDIPVGDLVSYTFGWEEDQFFSRFYSGIDIRHGEFIRNFGYLSGGLQAGGFLYDQNIEQGVLRLQSQYISKLISWKQLKLRQFFQVDYTIGLNRFPEESLGFDRRQDIRGFLADDIYGNEKLILKAETVGFTDIYYYGFRVALYGFCDIGFLGSEKNFIFDNPMKSGFGLGLRLRNENFVFNTFQIRLGFYPSLTAREAFMFNLSGEKNLSPTRYTPAAPQVVDF